MLARKVVEKKDLTPHMLLVGMNTGSAHVENCMAFSQKKLIIDNMIQQVYSYISTQRIWNQWFKVIYVPRHSLWHWDHNPEARPSQDGLFSALEGLLSSGFHGSFLPCCPNSQQMLLQKQCWQELLPVGMNTRALPHLGRSTLAPTGGWWAAQEHQMAGILLITTGPTGRHHHHPPPVMVTVPLLHHPRTYSFIGATEAKLPCAKASSCIGGNN